MEWPVTRDSPRYGLRGSFADRLRESADVKLTVNAGRGEVADAGLIHCNGEVAITIAPQDRRMGRRRAIREGLSSHSIPDHRPAKRGGRLRISSASVAGFVITVRS